MYHGDIRLGDTIDIKFCTVATTGAPTTLAGTPSVAAYPGNSTTEVTAGITLTVDFDGRTGMHNVRIVASSGNGYATATNYTLVITAGTVSGTSVVGYCIGSFSIENRSALMPTTAARTLDVSAGGEAGLDWANIGSPTTAQNLSATNIDVDQVVASVSGAVGSVTGNVGGNVTGSVGSVASGGISSASFATTAGAFDPLGIVDQGTAQSATSTTIRLRSAAAFSDDELIGATVLITGGSAGVGQSRLITDYVSSTDTATVDTWTTTPSGTITYKVFATAPSSGGGSGLDAAGVRAAIGLASANLDTQLGTIGTNVDSILVDTGTTLDAALAVVGANVDAILVDTGTTLQGVVDTIQADTDDIQARLPAVLVGGRMDSNVGAISADATAADNLEAALDGTGGVTITAGLTGNITGNLSGSVGSLTTNNDKTGYRLSATGVDDILDDAITEPSAVPAWASATVRNALAYIFAKASNRQTETATTYTLRNRANSADIATSTNSDDGTTTVKGSDT